MSNENSNNILVIGNGFDLAHGLKTRYNDFIAYMRNKKYDGRLDDPYAKEIKSIVGVEKNGFINYFLEYINAVPGWVDMERLIKRIIDQFQDLFEHYREYLYDKLFLAGKMPPELYDVLQKFNLTKNICYSRDVASRFSLDAYKGKYGLNTEEIIQMLREQLDGLIRALECYLILETELNPIDKNKVKKQIAKINPSYVISFNYTTTYRLYGINDDDVFHVHGKILSEPNNMVLGFNDEDPENLDFVYFKKYFQRIQKRTGYIDEGKFAHSITTEIHTDGKNTLKRNPESVAHFYGHSMDETDKDLIQKIDSLSKKLVIYYLNQEDYEKKVINLIKIFGKDVATKNIQVGKFQFVKCEESKQNMKE